MIVSETTISRHAVHEKFFALKEFLRPKLLEGLVIAFSGGVDSAFLTWTADQQRWETGGDLVALTTLSESFSLAQRRDAEQFIENYGIRHIWHESKELLNPEYAVNDANRCFHCKTELFSICREMARNLDLKWVAYGYNASDRGDIRPGHRAAVENNILSPLAEAGLSKDDIRHLMRENGLEMAEKPASPCLSSRLMTGVFITPQKLKDIDEFETILRDGGLRVFRVRLHEEGPMRFLRIEVHPDEMLLATGLREQIVSEATGRGYKWVTLDLAGYKTGGGNLVSK